MMHIMVKNIYSMGKVPTEKPEYIDEKRWESIQKTRSEDNKLRSLASGYLLDRMCWELGVVRPVYEYEEKGKPALKDMRCAFNLSHSGDYAVLAYHAGEARIGVDIQELRTMRDGMERRILHEKEKFFMPQDTEERLHYLNRLWTVKESFVKMTGEGLSRDFRMVFADLESGTVMGEDDVSAEFSVWQWKDDYYLAVCTVSREEHEIIEIV